MNQNPTPTMKRTIEWLLELLATHGGTIESTASLNINDINQARASGRLYVDENSLGYAWMPSVNDMFPETEDQIKQFEKWFPLDVELPKELENLDWMKKKKSPDHPLPDGYVGEGESNPQFTLVFSIDQMKNCFNEARLTHPMIGYKHETFEDYLKERTTP